MFTVSMRWCWKQEHSNQRLLLKTPILFSSSWLEHCWIKIMRLVSGEVGTFASSHWRHILCSKMQCFFKEKFALFEKCKVCNWTDEQAHFACVFPSSDVHHHLIDPKQNSCAWLYCNSDSIKPFIDDTVAVVPVVAAPWRYRSWLAWKPCCCFLCWPLVISIWFWNPRNDVSVAVGNVCCQWVLLPSDLEICRIRIHLGKQTQSPRNLLRLSMSIDPGCKNNEEHT